MMVLHPRLVMIQPNPLPMQVVEHSVATGDGGAMSREPLLWWASTD